jgi:hypothetical protein
VLLSLATSHKIGLGAMAVSFAVLAFTAAMIVPRYKPGFPGKAGLRLFIVAAMVLTAGTLLAVEFLAVEKEEPGGHGENVPAASAGK